MPRRKKYKFGQMEFTSKEAVRRHASTIRRKYPVGQTIDAPEDVGFLEDLIRCHVEHDTKIGVGIARFFWGPAPQHDSECFWIERTDGTPTDFGVPACLQGIGGINRQSLRMAIAPQLEDFRRQRLAGRSSTFVSEYSGQEFPIDEAVVDHIREFESIVREFFDAKGIDLEAELLTRSVDQQSLPEWRDPGLLQEFLTYHLRCPLRVVQRRENLSQIKVENGRSAKATESN